MVKQVTFKPIGVVKTAIKKAQDTKRGLIDKTAFIEIDKAYQDGLKGLKDFSHIVVVFYFHLSESYELFVRPLKYNPENKTVGVFATHSPFRPNAVGVSVVKLVEVKDNLLFVENKDMLDGSPVLDIKPYLGEDTGMLKLGWYVPKKHGGDV